MAQISAWVDGIVNAAQTTIGQGADVAPMKAVAETVPRGRASAWIVLLVAAATGLTPFLVTSLSDDGTALGQRARVGSVWVGFDDPVQCGGNPWEKSWAASHPGEPYPIGSHFVADEKEQAWLRQYFRGQGATVGDIEVMPWDCPVCDACGCHAGYTLYLRVPRGDLATMETFGFRLVER